jgi:hypothetical protein
LTGFIRVSGARVDSRPDDVIHQRGVNLFNTGQGLRPLSRTRVSLSPEGRGEKRGNTDFQRR